MKKKAKKGTFVIGKSTPPAKTRVHVLNGNGGKYVSGYTIYADPEKVANAVEKALRAQFG